MDAKKRYDQSDTEKRISRLAKPQRMYIFLPVFIAITLVLHPVFYSHISFQELLKAQLSHVSLIAMAAMIIPGIKLDKDSRRLYQALCVPVDSINLDHITDLLDTRHETLKIILFISFVAMLATTFLVYQRVATPVHYGCIAGVTANYLGDKRRIIEKLNEDMARENTAV